MLEVVEKVIKEFCKEGKNFTSLDVSNKVKEEIPTARHQNIAEMMKSLLPFDPLYKSSVIEVQLDNFKVKTLLYHKKDSLPFYTLPEVVKVKEEDKFEIKYLIINEDGRVSIPKSWLKRFDDRFDKEDVVIDIDDFIKLNNILVIHFGSENSTTCYKLSKDNIKKGFKIPRRVLKTIYDNGCCEPGKRIRVELYNDMIILSEAR